MNEELHWVTAVSSGVPLLLCPKELAPLWEGILPPSGGRIIESSIRFSSRSNAPATDYDFACEIAKDYVQTINIGKGQALVLGDEIPFATWIESESFTGGYIVIPCTFSDEEPDYSDVVTKIPHIEFKDTSIEITAYKPGFVLFPSTDQAEDDDSLAIECETGVYTVSIAFYRTDDTETRIFKVEKVAEI